MWPCCDSYIMRCLYSSGRTCKRVLFNCSFIYKAVSYCCITACGVYCAPAKGSCISCWITSSFTTVSSGAKNSLAAISKVQTPSLHLQQCCPLLWFDFSSWPTGNGHRFMHHFNLSQHRLGPHLDLVKPHIVRIPELHAHMHASPISLPSSLDVDGLFCLPLCSDVVLPLCCGMHRLCLATCVFVA
jgi:hypothetical protein